jgi:hypothetical protein
VYLRKNDVTRRRLVEDMVKEVIHGNCN